MWPRSLSFVFCALSYSHSLRLHCNKLHTGYFSMHPSEWILPLNGFVAARVCCFVCNILVPKALYLNETGGKWPEAMGVHGRSIIFLFKSISDWQLREYTCMVYTVRIREKVKRAENEKDWAKIYESWFNMCTRTICLFIYLFLRVKRWGYILWDWLNVYVNFITSVCKQMQ